MGERLCPDIGDKKVSLNENLPLSLGLAFISCDQGPSFLGFFLKLCFKESVLSRA